MATEAYALEAHVYIPTRAIAFLAEGQNVRLRYDAFPYQRYGFSTGKVEKISKSIYSDASQGQGSETNSNLRFYRAVVRIDKQTIRIDDKPVRLQNGITVTADIFYDKRRIWQWILSPISNMSTGS